MSARFFIRTTISRLTDKTTIKKTFIFDLNQ